MVSIQNPYSFLNRSFEVGLAEIALREDCGLLAYAPLGAGTLTGKYLGGARPEGARLTLHPQNRRYQGPRAEAAISAYRDLAESHGLDPAQMALAYVTSPKTLDVFASTRRVNSIIRDSTSPRTARASAIASSAVACARIV